MAEYKKKWTDVPHEDAEFAARRSAHVARNASPIDCDADIEVAYETAAWLRSAGATPRKNCSRIEGVELRELLRVPIRLFMKGAESVAML